MTERGEKIPVPAAPGPTWPDPGLLPDGTGPGTGLPVAPHDPPPAHSRRGRWGLLAERDFRMLWLGETASGFGNALTTTALPLIAVLTLQVSTFQVGLLAALVWIPWLVVGLPAGAWVDRIRRRPLMIACNLVSAGMFVSVPVAKWAGTLTFTHLVVAATVAGTTMVFFGTAYQVYLPTIVGKPDLIEGNAKMQGSEAATRVIGPGAGGLLTQWLGAVAGLFVDALTFLASTVCLLLIRAREPQVRRPERSEPLRRQIAVGFRFVVRDPYLRTILLWGAALNLALNGWQAVQIVFLIKTVGLNAATVGVLLMVGSLGGVLGALGARALSRWLGTGRGMVICQLATAPFALLMPLASKGPALILYAVGALVVVGGVVACNIVMSGFRQSYCPPQMLGRAVATSMVILHSTIPVGALLGGLLGEVLGPRPTMWIMTALFAPCAMLLLAGPIRRRRDLPSGYAAPSTTPDLTH